MELRKTDLSFRNTIGCVCEYALLCIPKAHRYTV